MKQVLTSVEKKEYRTPRTAVIELRDAFLDGGAGASGTGGAEEGDANSRYYFDDEYDEYDEIF